VDGSLRAIEQNRDVILGMKVRLTRNIAGDHDIAALRLAREAAEAVNLPLMAHIGGTASPLAAILKELRKGDVITHSFHGHSGGILDSQGRVLAEVRKAVENGVGLDVGHGRGSFSWRVMDAAMKQGVLPGTISSDVHQFNVAGPVFDLATSPDLRMQMGHRARAFVEAKHSVQRLPFYLEGLYRQVVAKEFEAKAGFGAPSFRPAQP